MMVSSRRRQQGRAMRRGDNIPPVSDYAHWNEDAERVWYEENRYDMEHADELIEDDEDLDYDEPEPDFYEEFDNEEAARAYYKSIQPKTGGADSLSSHRDPRTGQVTWSVEGWKKRR